MDICIECAYWFILPLPLNSADFQERLQAFLYTQNTYPNSTFSLDQGGGDLIIEIHTPLDPDIFV